MYCLIFGKQSDSCCNSNSDPSRKFLSVSLCSDYQTISCTLEKYFDKEQDGIFFNKNIENIQKVINDDNFIDFIIESQTIFYNECSDHCGSRGCCYFIILQSIGYDEMDQIMCLDDLDKDKNSKKYSKKNIEHWIEKNITDNNDDI
jgi:hypothetical protein